MKDLAYTLISSKSFDEIVANLEKQIPKHQFRVLAVHNVQQTLADKGLERGPLKIVELCNAKFAHEALQKDISVAMFMPCRFTIHEEGDKTVVTLSRPAMIAEMMPHIGLSELATSVEATLTKVMKASI